MNSVRRLVRAIKQCREKEETSSARLIALALFSALGPEVTEAVGCELVKLI